MEILKDKKILIIGLIALVNMLGYGIVIPILYAYSKKFGISDFENGILFATFSVCQFLATPIIGRLSDKYGRRPLLIISITGTAISFLVMAFAQNLWFLFAARAIDGLTAGNIPVAFAVISDSTKPEQRARAFGIISASFSVGFVFGPAISAFTVGFGTAVPFLIAAAITILAVALTFVFLPETNQHIGEVRKGKLFDFPLLWHTLFDPRVGITFIISLLYFLAFSCAIIYGFQPFTAHVLHINASLNAILFTILGVVGLFSQTVLVQRFSRKFGVKKAFSLSIFITAVSFLLMFFANSLTFFVGAMILLGLFNGFAQTLIPTILSEETDPKSQGSIMGLNASYQSLGMIFGPILGGIVASAIAIPMPFLVGSILIFVCFYLSFKTLRPGPKDSAFVLQQ